MSWPHPLENYVQRIFLCSFVTKPGWARLLDTWIAIESCISQFWFNKFTAGRFDLSKQLDSYYYYIDIKLNYHTTNCQKNQGNKPIQSTPCTIIMVLSGAFSSLSSDAESESPSCTLAGAGKTVIRTSTAGRRPWPGIIALERVRPWHTCLVSHCKSFKSVSLSQSVSELIGYSASANPVWPKWNQWCPHLIDKIIICFGNPMLQCN